ncbi:MAG: AAA family ATPase [Anaerolinea sp.]|nr:AAA family ATPase [Anaerolinea sp.]
MLHIILLGQPRLALHSQALKLNAPPKTLPLLAYLLLHRRQPLERQQVAFTLWPDDPEPTARANLRRHLHWLNRLLPPAPSPTQPWMLTTPSTIQWNPHSDFWLDVAEFEKLVTRPETLPDALALYVGPLFETLYDDWIFFERERLQNDYIAALTQLMEQRRAAGAFAEASGYARRLLHLDPFREDTVRQLIAIHYEAGDRAGAIAEYQRFARSLRQEMGVDPMPETQALYEIVLRHGRLPGSHTSPALAETDERVITLLPFVGRSSEMAHLAARWQRAAHGRGGLLLIGGEAGVGKTRLARELALLAENQGARVLVGGSAQHKSISYQAVAEALQAALPLLASLEGETLRLAALAPLLPDLRARRSLPTLPAIRPDQEQTRLFDAVAGCLEKLSEPRPLLLILEDLHWASESTLALVEFLARRLAQAPVLIVGTYREEETPRSHPLAAMRRRLQAEKLVEGTPLRRLGVTAVAQLLAQLSTPAPELAASFHAASAGNPLFLNLLLQEWRETGQAADETNGLPDSIRAAIERRFTALSAPARAYADVAAIFGPTFDPDAVREVGGWGECQALDALDELLDRQLACDAAPGRNYHFAHHLIQSTLYTAVPPAKRKIRHRRTAEVLESLYPEQVREMAATLAHHYDHGSEAGRAIAHYLAAAQGYTAVYADAEALIALNRALELVAAPTPIAPRLHFDLLLVREGIYQRRSQREQQLPDLQQLAALLPRLDDMELTCVFWRRQVIYDKDINDYASQKIHLDHFKREATALGSLYWQAEVIYAEGVYLKILDKYQTAAIRLQEALDVYRQAQRIEGQVDCCCHLAEISIINRQSAEAELWTQRALALCPSEQPTPQLMFILWSMAANGLISKDLSRCLEYASRLLTAAELGGVHHWQAAAHRLLGMAYQRQFLIGAAQRSLNAALDLYRQMQHTKGVAITLQTMGHVEVSLGRYAAASRHYQTAFELVEKLNDEDGMASECLNLAYAAALQADYAAEGEYARRALVYARQVQNRHLEGLALQNLGEAEREGGDLTAARQHLLAALALLDDPALFEERAGILADLALTHWKAGDLPLAQETAAEMLAIYSRIEGNDDNAHRLLWTAVQIFRAANQPEQAAALLAQAYAAFQHDLAAIPDDESRRAFAAMIHNRQIAAAYERDEWPEGNGEW